ncbi:EAL and HDOD domain-containing protein [Niallia sp. 01092]|uniref:EAL and HDOD domain-containing protein n=1 Tax=unclassified Niallia TaxID=2837522 RepID=UPI003FD0261E
MEVFVARQPLFNRMEEVYGYEILYRNNEINHFPNIDGEQATADVIINSFLNIGIEKLSHGKPCFINFTQHLLELKLPTYFQPKDFVIEILETVVPSEKIVRICQELKSLGYKIALDDYVFDKHNSYAYELLLLADIVKIDFMNTSEETRTELEMLVKSLNIIKLAEKLETREAYEKAKSLGYELFQGYFFSKPYIISTQDVPTCSQTYINIMQFISAKNPKIDVISDLIEQDVSLSYKLLKLINTIGYGLKHKVTNIRQAIVLLGLKELKKWLYVLAVREKDSQNGISQEIMNLSLVRARMCELVAKLLPTSTNQSGYFLTGMFSLMDSILNLPMKTILKQVPLDETISDALVGKKNIQRDVLDLVLAVEKAEWTTVSNSCKELMIEEKELLHTYTESVNWSKQLLEERTR